MHKNFLRPFKKFNKSIYLLFTVDLYLSTYLSIYLSIYISIYLSINLSIYVQNSLPRLSDQIIIKSQLLPGSKIRSSMIDR